MNNQVQEECVTVSVSGSVKGVAEMMARMFNAAQPPDDIMATDADGNLLSEVVRERCFGYTDEDGKVLYRVKRREWKTGAKTFECEVAKPDGRFGRGSIERKVPYNLPAVMEAAKNGGEVAVCNGERAADAYAARHGKTGIVATTFYGGLRSCNDKYASYFSGVGKVVVVDDGIEPDEDWLGITKFVKALKKRGITIEYVSEAEAGVEQE